MSGTNHQFSIGVHMMSALGDHYGELVTSKNLTDSLQAHETQVRLVLSKLVKAGLVSTVRGRYGSCALSKPADEINLLEIYKAVEAPPVFSVHRYPPDKTCRTSRMHKEAMTEVLHDAQEAFEQRLSERTLSEMVEKAKKKR